MVGPTHMEGSLPPYIDTLARELCALGASVDRLGMDSIPVDEDTRVFWSEEEVEVAAKRLLNEVTLTNYDLISIYFGNDEIEQLIPVLWKDLPRPPAVYHVHNTDHSLFSESIPNADLYDAVIQSLHELDGFVHFSNFSKKISAPMLGMGKPSIVSFYTTGIPPDTKEVALEDALGFKIAWSNKDFPLLSMFGFASPWKDLPVLLNALERIDSPTRFILGGPGWRDPRRARVDLSEAMASSTRRIGKTEITLLPTFLNHEQRLALMRSSAAGVFPYISHNAFQGSGVVTEYLAEGIPVVATNVGSFQELVGGGGLVVPPNDAESLALAIKQLLSPSQFATCKQVAKVRAPLFSPQKHAEDCMEFYESLLLRRGTASKHASNSLTHTFSNRTTFQGRR